MALVKKNLSDELQKEQFKKDRSFIKKQISVIEHNLDYSEMFKGNPNLKRAGIKIPYSKDQIKEIKRCLKDPKYFINNYCYIVNLDTGLTLFRLRDYQAKLTDLFHNNNRLIIKQPRQSGKTVTTAGYAVWQAIFQPYSQIAILANKASTAIGILQKVRLIYENLPSWMQVGVLTWNKGSIELENGSSIKASSTSSSAIRSMSISTLIIDEMAFVPTGIWTEFFESVFPTVSSSKKSKIILISTPKGMNHFWAMWNDSINENSDFVNYEIMWNDVPGRDENFKKNIIDSFGASYFNQEFACEFLGSAGTLIDGSKLKIMSHNNTIAEKFDNKLKIYELPIKEEKKKRIISGKYVIIFDTAEGTGNDYSTVQVFNIDEKPYKQVALYRDNLISIRDFPLIIEKIAILFNNALVIGENNTIGASILNDLVYDLEYENVFYDDDFGIRMTKTSKSIGNSNLKTNIEDNHFLITDYNTIQELTTYIRVKNSYEADKNKHDDTITPLVLFSYFLRNKQWIDIWMDQERESASKAMIEALEEDLLPVGFVSNGNGIHRIGEDISDGEIFFPFY